MHRLLTVIWLLFWSTCAPAVETLEIRDAWIREAPPGVSPLAGYMEIRNTGEKTVTLESISSPAFERIELHQTSIENDRARMERKENLTVAAGQTLVLQPGGCHIMLFKPARRLQAGDTVTLTLGFKDRRSLTFEAGVRRGINNDASHHQHH